MPIDKSFYEHAWNYGPSTVIAIMMLGMLGLHLRESGQTNASIAAALTAQTEIMRNMTMQHDAIVVNQKQIMDTDARIAQQLLDLDREILDLIKATMERNGVEKRNAR